MHEVSLAGNLIDTALEHLPPGKQLQRITVSIGPLAGVCADSLGFCFEAVATSRGSPDIQLTIRSVAAVFICTACRTEYRTDSVYATCPTCDSLERTVMSGDQFTIDAIETKD